MFFSYNKAIRLRPKKERALSTFFFALLVSAAMLVPYILTRTDYFISIFKSALLELPLMLFYSNAAVGSLNQLESGIPYVFASPVAYATYIPEFLMPYIMGAVMALRIALAALTAYFFIRRFVRLPETARLGGILYAFSSAVIGITLGGGMQNAVVLFPLILLSLEKLLTENKKLIFFLAVFLCVLLSGYAASSVAIFLIIYFLFRVTGKDVFVSFSVILRVIFELILGVLCAAVTFIPLVYITTVNSVQPADFVNITAIFSEGAFIEILRGMFFPTESVINPIVLSPVTSASGMFGMYLPLISLSGAISYCIAKRHSTFKRIAVFSIICQFVPIINKFIAISNPSALYMWTYMPTLILALISVMALEDRDVNLFSGAKWTAFITVLLAAIILLFPNTLGGGISFGLYSGAFNKAGFIRFGIYALLSVLGIIASAVIYKMTENRSVAFFNALTVGALILAAISVWLYIATEISFFTNNLENIEGVNNSAFMVFDAVRVNQIAYYCRFISVIALGALLIYIIFCIATRNLRRAMKYPYPEGEILLDKWQERDEEDDVIDFSDDTPFSLENIAENLGNEYPVKAKESEFLGGFSIIDNENRE